MTFTSTMLTVPTRLAGASAVSVWSKLPDRVIYEALVDVTISCGLWRYGVTSTV